MRTWYVHFTNSVGHTTTIKVRAGNCLAAIRLATAEYREDNRYSMEVAQSHVTEVGIWSSTGPTLK